MQSDIEYLKNLSFFEGFTNSELEQLLELNRIDRYNKGEHILKENEVDENNEGFYFVILRGSVDIIKQKKKLSTLEIGDCFGELAYLINQKRTADVIAVSDETLVMEINGKNVQLETGDFLRISPKVKRALKASDSEEIIVICVGGVGDAYPKNPETRALIDDGIPFYDEVPKWFKGNDKVREINRKLKERNR